MQGETMPRRMRTVDPLEAVWLAGNLVGFLVVALLLFGR